MKQAPSAKTTTKTKPVTRLFAIFSLVGALALAACLSLGIAAQPAFAGSAFDGPSSPPAPAAPQDIPTEKAFNAGNQFIFGGAPTDTNITNDLFWAGQELNSEKLEVGTSGHGSMFAAGQSITVKNSTISDSFFGAAQTIEIAHAEVGNNLFLAAESITLGNKVKGNAVYAFAKNLVVSGTYNGGGLTGETVTFDGVVEGDLFIDAENIEIGKNAQVKGTLKFPSNAQTNIAEGAQVANVVETDPAESSEPTFFDNLVQMVYAILAHLVLAGLFLILIRPSILGAANVAREKLVKQLLAGLVVMIAAPFVCIALFLPLVTIPVAVLIILVATLISLFAIPFAGSALGMMLLDKQMNPFVAAIVGTVALTVLAYLPVVSFAAVVFSIMFTTGYLWMRYREGSLERKQARLAAKKERQQAAQNMAEIHAAEELAGQNNVPAPEAPADSAPAPAEAPAPEASQPPAPQGSPVETPATPPAPEGSSEQK